MKFYIAAGFEEKEKVRSVYQTLKKHGHEITVDWTEHEGVEIAHRDHKETIVRDYAMKDFNGVISADVFILLAEPHDGRGKYVELGVALHANIVSSKPLVYVVGKATNLCNILTQITRLKSLVLKKTK